MYERPSLFLSSKMKFSNLKYKYEVKRFGALLCGAIFETLDMICKAKMFLLKFESKSILKSDSSP